MKVKQKGVCIDCGLVAPINTFSRCRRCQSKKTGSYWLPSEERSFTQRMVWRYIENKTDNDFENG